MKVARGDTFNKLIVKTYLAGLTREEKRTWLKYIDYEFDPREMSFWKDVMGLYPPPELTPKTKEVVEAVLKEQINAERKAV